jgi:hypothetical protein
MRLQVSWIANDLKDCGGVIVGPLLPDWIEMSPGLPTEGLTTEDGGASHRLCILSRQVSGVS